jgi:hypothetical protein
MFRNDDADVGTVDKRKVNLRQAFSSGGRLASRISWNAAADSRLTVRRHRNTIPAANRV